MNNHYYKDKICVVTGASSKIGLALMKVLIEEEAMVYALDTRPCDLVGVINVYCDLSDKDSIDDAFLNIPDEIDSFFGINKSIDAYTDFYTTFTMYFVANKYITDQYLSYRMTDNASICFVSSSAGEYWNKYPIEFRSFMKANSWDRMIDLIHKKTNDHVDCCMAYPFSLRALQYYTAIKAIDLGERGIRINTVVTAFTDIKILKELQSLLKAKNDFLDQDGIANRVANPDEIAKPMLFLNSDMASFITGTALYVDSGNNALIKIGKKKDPLDTKLSNKIFKQSFVQSDNDILDPMMIPVVQYDQDGIEIL